VVLQRDEPHTAQALLHPHLDEAVQLPAAAAATDPLSTARCDMLGEALGTALCQPPTLLPPPRAPTGEYGWDLGAVSAWVEQQTRAKMGFIDQVIVDTVMRWLSTGDTGSTDGAPPHPSPKSTLPHGAPPHASPKTAAAAAMSAPDSQRPVLGAAPNSQRPVLGAALLSQRPVLGAALLSQDSDNLSGLQAHLAVLMDAPAASALVAGLIGFLNSDEARGPLPPPNTALTQPGAGPMALNTARLPAEVLAWCHPDIGTYRVLALSDVADGILLVLQSPTAKGLALLQQAGVLGRGVRGSARECA
jgi:hypothetical protein